MINEYLYEDTVSLRLKLYWRLLTDIESLPSRPKKSFLCSCKLVTVSTLHMWLSVATHCITSRGLFAQTQVFASHGHATYIYNANQVTGPQPEPRIDPSLPRHHLVKAWNKDAQITQTFALSVKS